MQQQPQQPAQQWGRVKLTEVNPHLVCVLCHGYFIDATTMAECPHSFCRSCIILYLESKSYCPICEVQIHKTKPHLNLKPDKTLQDIVYKLVPGLFHSEMRRRREFYQKHPNRDMYLSPEARGVGIERIIYSPEDSISLSLEYYDKEREREEWAAARPGEQKLETIIKVSEKPSTDNGGESSSSSTNSSTTSGTSSKRYLQCPAVVTMRHLKKFIRMKYNLSQACTVELLYRRESLPDSYSLMDVAYIYTWKRNGPMRFYYRIHVPTTVTRILPPPAKSSATVTELTADEKHTTQSGGELLDAVGLKRRNDENRDDKEIATATALPEVKKEEETVGQNKADVALTKHDVQETVANGVVPPSPSAKRSYDHDPLSVSLLLGLRNGHPKQPVTTTTAASATASAPASNSATSTTAATTTEKQSQDRRDVAPDSAMTSPSKPIHHTTTTTTVTTATTTSTAATTTTTTTSTTTTSSTATVATSQSVTDGEINKQQPVVSKQQMSTNYSVNSLANVGQRPTPSQQMFNGNRSGSVANATVVKPPTLDKIPLNRLIQQRNMAKNGNLSNANGGVRNNGQMLKPKPHHQTDGVQVNGVQVSTVTTTTTSSTSVFVGQDRSKYTTTVSSTQNKPLTVAEKVLKSAKYMPSTHSSSTSLVANRTQSKETSNSMLNQNIAQNSNNNNNSFSSTLITGSNKIDNNKPVAQSTAVANSSSDNRDKAELTKQSDQSPPQHRKEVNRLEQILKESLKRKSLSSNSPVRNHGEDTHLKNNPLLLKYKEIQEKRRRNSEDEIKKSEKPPMPIAAEQTEATKQGQQKDEESTPRRTAEGATLSGVAIKEADARAESPSAASIRDHVAASPAPTQTPAVSVATSSSTTTTTSILKRKLNDPAYNRGLVSFNTPPHAHEQENKKRRLVTPDVSIELTSKPNSVGTSTSNTVTPASGNHTTTTIAANNNTSKNHNGEGTDFSQLTRRFLESLQQIRKPNAIMSTTPTTATATATEYKFKDVDQLCASTVKIEKVPSSAVMSSSESVNHHANTTGGLVKPTAGTADETQHKRKTDTVEVTIQRVSDDAASQHSAETPPVHSSPKKMPRLIEINAPPRPKLSTTPSLLHHHQDRKQQKTGLKMTTVRKEVPIGKEIPTLVRKDVNGALDLSSGASTTTTTTTSKVKSSFQRPQTTPGCGSSRSPTTTVSTSSLAPLLAMTSFPVPEMKASHTSPPIRVPTLKQKTPLHLQPRPSSLSSSSPSPPADSSRPTPDVFSAAAFQQYYRHQLELQNRLLASQVSNNNNNNNNNSWRQDPVTAKKLEDWMRTVMTCGGLSPHPLMFPAAQLSPESHRK